MRVLAQLLVAELLHICVGADVAFMRWNIDVSQRNRLGPITMLLNLALWISKNHLCSGLAAIDTLCGRVVHSRASQRAVELEGACVREALIVGASRCFTRVFCGLDTGFPQSLSVN